jgi:AcrR family transcriptional regulator
MQKRKELSSRERIIKTATDLFYRQGYHQTGINQIIEESGVAKATFYGNFKSKEDLCIAYLRELDRADTDAIKNMLDTINDPRERYMAIIKGVKDYIEETDFRGCAFGNIAVEITEPDHPIRKEVRLHEERFRSILRDVVRDLKNSRAKYKHISVEQVTDNYYLIVEGAISASKNYNDTWPLERAVEAVERIIE